MNSIGTRAQWPSSGIICTFVCLPARLLAMATIWGEHFFAQSYVSLATMLESSKIATKFENGTGFATIKYINWQKFTQLMHTQTHRLLNPACTYVHVVISDPLSKKTAHPTILILNLSLLDRSFSSWTQIVTLTCYRGIALYHEVQLCMNSHAGQWNMGKHYLDSLVHVFQKTHCL